MKLRTIIILFIFLLMLAFGQLYEEFDVAINNDKDGFTLIRKAHNNNSEIADTLFTGEFFQYIKTDSSDWYQVYKMWNISGYVHKSRIQSLKSFKKKEIILLKYVNFVKVSEYSLFLHFNS